LLGLRKVDENDGAGDANALIGEPTGVFIWEMDPVSRSTNFRAAVLPEKNSVDEREGSSEGAGGKMSDWKESALRGTTNAMGSMFDPETL